MDNNVLQDTLKAHNSMADSKTLKDTESVRCFYSHRNTPKDNRTSSASLQGRKTRQDSPYIASILLS